MEIDKGLPHGYDFELLDELPGGSAIDYYFPPESQGRGVGGVMVRVDPPGGPGWIGFFSAGIPVKNSSSRTGIYTCPSNGSICVVSKGAGYVVGVGNPSDYSVLEPFPIMNAWVLADRGVLIFLDPWEFFAYNACGLMWRTGRIAVDGFHQAAVDRMRIHGRADTLCAEDAEFCVDIDTGKWWIV